MTSIYNKLQTLLNSDRHLFSNYQEIPRFILEKILDEKFSFSYEAKQLALDAPRYEFLTSTLDCTGMDVVEIGSNLGYFCLSLTHEHQCKAIGFEPIKNYKLASDIFTEISMLTKSCKFDDRSVSLEDICSLPEAQLYIELNVMHHAGVVFDKKTFEKFGCWRDYAIARLGEFRKKSEYLFFQTGNTASGSTLFSSSDSVYVVADIIEKSGWEIQAVGTIPDLSTLEYEKQNKNQLAQGTTYNCFRNPMTNLVDYFSGDTLSASLSTGLASRPIWLCRNTT